MHIQKQQKVNSLILSFMVCGLFTYICLFTNKIYLKYSMTFYDVKISPTFSRIQPSSETLKRRWRRIWKFRTWQSDSGKVSINLTAKYRKFHFQFPPYILFLDWTFRNLPWKVYFSELSTEAIQSLYSLYELDFQLLQYSSEEYFKYATDYRDN